MPTANLDCPVWPPAFSADTLTLLAARGLRRCERCGRILISRRLIAVDGGRWQCRDQADCSEALTDRSFDMEPAFPVPMEDRSTPAPPLAVVVAEPGCRLGQFYCGHCWHRFAEDQLVEVQEEFSRSYRCRACLPTLHLPGSAHVSDTDLTKTAAMANSQT